MGGVSGWWKQEQIPVTDLESNSIRLYLCMAVRESGRLGLVL